MKKESFYYHFIDIDKVRAIRENLNAEILRQFFDRADSLGIDDDGLAIALQCEIKHIKDLRARRDYLYAFEMVILNDFLDKVEEHAKCQNEEEKPDEEA